MGKNIFLKTMNILEKSLNDAFNETQIFRKKNKYYYYNIDTNLFGSVIFSFFKRKVH